MDDFTDKVGVVTGGASGIGLALVERLLAEGARVVVADVEEEPLRCVEDRLRSEGHDVHGVVTDVTDPAQVDALAAATLEHHGEVHVVCNNAGVAGGGFSWEVPLEEWEWILGVNMWGVIHGVRAFVPLLMRHDDAHIVNTASVAGLVAAPFMGAYNASKHAVVAISETLYFEQLMLGTGVKVHTLCPGWVNTRILESDRNRPVALGGPDDADDPQARALRSVVQTAIAEGMTPAAVADKVVAAMRAERFWVLTHDDDEWRRAVDEVHRSVVEGTNPGLVDVVTSHGRSSA